MRPTVAEISHRALLNNYRLLADTVCTQAGESAGLIAVVKANAYGHGVELCGRALAEAGAPWLGVTSVGEALALRAALAGLESGEASRGPRLLVMSGFFPGEEAAVLAEKLTPQVWEPWHMQLLGAAARRLAARPQSVPVHLELDTGMSRQGVGAAALGALLEMPELRAADTPLLIEGVLTHFSSPEMPAADGGPGAVMELQMQSFAAALEQLWTAGVRPRWVHAGNSANALAGVGRRQLGALARRFGAELLVRPGLSLYGVPVRFPAEPAASTGEPSGLEPVMTWKTEVVSLREVRPGTSVGYNETFAAGATGARLALLPVGYADGLRRELSNRGSVLIRGRRAPVAGRVSMDQTVVDITAVPEAAIGDEVVLLGRQGAEAITAWEVADACGTIPYEVLCGIAGRVSRTLV